MAAGCGSVSVGRLSLTKSPLTVVPDTTPTFMPATEIISPACACAADVPAPTWANPAWSSWATVDATPSCRQS